ncbi:MAG: type I-MYXAN CRISPR-associated protein Cas5/Cmx5/DevS [Candidatus Obscuribacterales bacterium]|nr:type I-MYXAN CRISPR-associated protein Cas5/Cmx5/DevS [Candidatus Obscuribacterales bacterium]
MIAVHVSAPFGSFRKSYARSFAETYALPPPATIYGMLLSLVGEKHRSVHDGVRIALAFKNKPRVATTLRKLSRYKYGVASKQSELGNAPDYVETLCNIEFLCWVDSSSEKSSAGEPLENRLKAAISTPECVDRFGIVCLGLSDDAVDDVSLCTEIRGKWLRLLQTERGALELPVWVDHIGAAQTRWQRYELEGEPVDVSGGPEDSWQWTKITAPVLST